jgi:hypothetical protein
MYSIAASPGDMVGVNPEEPENFDDSDDLDDPEDSGCLPPAPGTPLRHVYIISQTRLKDAAVGVR